MKVTRSDDVIEYEAPDQPLRRIRILADPEDTGAKHIALGMSIYGMGEKASWHKHVGEETIVIIHGKGRFSTREQSVEVTPSTVLYFSPGEEHMLENIGTQSFEFIFAYTPPGDQVAIKKNWIQHRR